MPYRTRKAMLKFIISPTPTETVLFSTQSYNHFRIYTPELQGKGEALCAHHFFHQGKRGHNELNIVSLCDFSLHEEEHMLVCG